MEKKTIIKIEHLKKSFHTNGKDILVLNDINMEIKERDIYGILGLSGAGKSTLVRCINGLEKFDEGTIYYDGQEVEFSKEYHRNVAMIFQQFNLLQQRTVLKNVELPGEIVKDKNRKEKALALLKMVGLEDKVDCYPSQLSGGQQQRVAIARALMTEPKVLLCDEATSALDPETTSSILSLLKRLNEELSLTIIIISHQLSVIETICNKVAILDESKIVEDGLIYDVFLSPKTKISKKLIYSGHVNTKLDDKRLIKLIFNGEIDAPIITNIIQNCNILVSIVYADSKVVEDKIYGQMIFRLPYYDDDIKKLKKYLDINLIHYEEVNQDELA